MNTLSTYNERSLVRQKEVEAEIIPLILAELERGKTNLMHGANLLVESTNQFRQIGIHLQTLCGHENITFRDWKLHVENKLPISFGAARVYMSIARRLANKAKTVAEAVDFTQLLLVSEGAIPIPQRDGPQAASTIDPIQKFVVQLAMMRKPFQKILNAGNGKLDRARMELFMSESEWIAEEREKFKEILEA